jgi:hypothetical protein
MLTQFQLLDSGHWMSTRRQPKYHQPSQHDGLENYNLKFEDLEPTVLICLNHFPRYFNSFTPKKPFDAGMTTEYYRFKI